MAEKKVSWLSGSTSEVAGDNRIQMPATLDLTPYITKGLAWLKATDPQKLAESGNGWWGGWGYGDVTGRMVDAFVLARQALGEDEAPPEEQRTRAFLLSLFDARDGLSYRPKPLPMAHLFDQSSVLFGMVSWLLESASSKVAEHLERLVNGLWSIAAKEGDYCFYPLEAHAPGGWNRDYLVPIGLDPFSAADPCHEGGRQILPLVKYHELVGSANALSLARGLARYLMHHAGVFEEDGSYRERRTRVAGHVHSRLAAACGVLRLGVALGEQNLVDWARQVFDWTLQNLCTTFGWVPESAHRFERGSEGCAIADAIEIAINLATAGFHSYWNVVERFARNHLLEDQHPASGGFSCHSMPNDYCWNNNGVMEEEVSGCCSPAGVRALFLVQDHIVSRKGDRVAVNLALNRITPRVEVRSLLPHQGEVRVKVRDASVLAVRIPDWVEKSRTEVLANGKLARSSWEGCFAVLSGLRKGDTVVVRYPVRRLRLTDSVFGRSFEASWRGDTVIGISPPGDCHPLYRREELDTDAVRFVETEPPKAPAREVHW